MALSSGGLLIEIIFGLPGSGKTLQSVRRILEARRNGRRVICNFHSKKKIWEFGLWDDFIVAENAICVIDEAQMWLGSRAWAGNGVEDLAVFQQSRKNGLDLICIAQHWKRIDTAVREVCAFYHECRNVFGKYTSVRTYTPDDLEKPLGKKIFKHSQLLYGQYWTTEVIGARDGKGYQFGAASTGGVVTLENGRLTPNRTMFYTDFGNYSVPIEQKDEEFMRLAKLYNFSNGSFFVTRDFASVEGQIFFTDEDEQVHSAKDYKLLDQLVDSKLGQTVLRVEDRLLGRMV